MLSNQSQYVLAHRCLGGVKDQLVWSILPHVDFSNQIYDLATERKLISYIYSIIIIYNILAHTRIWIAPLTPLKSAMDLTRAAAPGQV